MKKWLTALILMLAIGCAAFPALALEAIDITNLCVITVPSGSQAAPRLTDKKYTTRYDSGKIAQPWVELTAPAGIPIQGLYICLADMPERWEVQVIGADGEWVTAVEGDTRFLHAWAPLPEPAARARLIVTQEEPCSLSINELYALSEGNIPDWVQRWEPTHEKADILFLSTHPDDELIFFGGAIPTYAAEQGRKVVVAYFTRADTTRQSELLNGLWLMGVKNYPVWGDFRDFYSKESLRNAYRDAGGKEKVLGWLTEVYRRYQPEVVVAQDVNGEYGHWQHRMVSDAAQLCVETAAAEDQYPDSAAAYGPWQVKKLYLHLWKENQIRLDWSVPLASMGGQTGLELAINAYNTAHISQHTTSFTVDGTGARYDNTLFGLAYTAVGPDVRKDDFLENIYDAPGVYSAPQTPSAPGPEPARAPGFLAEGEPEYVLVDEAKGQWIYISQTAKVVIQRREDPARPLIWYEAELWGDVTQGELLRTLWRDPDKVDAYGPAADTALRHQAVFAMNTDSFTYRRTTQGDERRGIIIRDGEILFDHPYSEKQVRRGFFPNLDTLALYPDGSMTVHHSYELSAQDYLDAGARTVLAYGPYLIRDGQLNESAYSLSRGNAPRCAIGMMEPGHYVAILCEGRLERSGGANLEYIAKLMYMKGCQVAFNLDGDQTAAMCFLGQQINLTGVYNGKSDVKGTGEILAFGTAEQVPLGDAP